MVLREQTLAYASLILLGVDTALTGWSPNVVRLYVTAVLMSIGFHYYETVATSLALQWIDKADVPKVFGQLLAAGSAAAVFAFCLVWFFFESFDLGYAWTYMVGGGITLLIGVFCRIAFPRFPSKISQHKYMVLRRRYWLYYALTFLSGARR